MSNGANGVHLQLREALENYIKSQYFGKSPILLSAAQNKPLMLLLALIGLAIGGLLFDYVDSKNENIYHSWVIHMFADFAIMTIWYLYI